MYASVPTIWPVVVCAAPGVLAIPKSATLTVPDASKMLLGLMSLCSSPVECAAESAESTFSSAT